MKQNQGTVLIFILAIAATLSAALVLMQTNAMEDTKRIKTLLAETESYYLAQSGQQLAHRVLKDDLNKGITDTMLENWYTFMEPKTYPIAGGEITVKLRDEQSLPNINELFTALAVREPYFYDIVNRYRTQKGIKFDFLNKAKDWIDPNDTTLSSGAENATYMRKTPAYRPANEKFHTLNELTLLDDYTPKYFSKIDDYFTVLPTYTQYNINTLNEDFVRQIFNLSAPTKLNQFFAKRKREGYATTAQALQELDETKVPQGIELNTFTKYFKLTSNANIHSQNTAFDVLYERINGKVVVRRFQWH